MKSIVANYRKRTGLTQQDVASMLHTDKSNISHIENNRRELTAGMSEAGFINIPESQMLNDLAYQTTQGYTSPTPSNVLYDDHRMSIKYRMKKEILELKDALHDHCLDKHPEFLTEEEQEVVHRVFSEAQDVLFEVQGFLIKLSADYDFIHPQKMNKNRDARLKLQKRI